jgi:methanethiol S-methyltransferase
MTAGAAEPTALAPHAAVPTHPPGWSLPFAWGGAALFVISLSYFVYAYVVRFGRAVEGDVHARPVLVDAALFTVFALHHSVFARHGAKAWLGRVMHPAVERAIYTWLASLLLIVVCARWEFVAGDIYRIPDPWSVIGYAAQACGIFFAFRGSKVLDVLDLAGVRPILNARAGRTPAHVPLVTDGVFRWVRHPIYLGWALFVFGSPHMTATRFVFAIISTAYLAMAIPWEERGLIKEFGAGYEEYRQRVRWRMVPGVY